MSFVTTCPQCRTRYTDVPEKADGVRISCRRCGHAFTVVLEAAAPPATQVDPQALGSAPTASPPEAEPPPTMLDPALAAPSSPGSPVPPTLDDAGATRAVRARPAAEEPPATLLDDVLAAGEPEALPEQDPAVAAAADVWHPGDTILDLYEVVELVGEGGMGRVYRVHHRGWDVDLAVKSPLPALMDSPGGSNAFVHEAETWINLGLHPNIVSCYYVRKVDSVPHLFAEFVAGGSLHQWIADGRIRDAAQAVDIGIQLAWGLSYAHENGLVHQDVKPANVMLSPQGDAKITDFGLARASAVARGPALDLGHGSTSVLVSSGGMTPAYCSPEQQAGESLSHRSDIWSWGVSMLQIFAGGVSWRSGAVAPRVLETLRRDGGVKGAPELPPALAELLLWCWRSAPRERPQSMQQVAAELIDIYRRISGSDYPRNPPRAGRDTADNLNNRAVSLLDLGRRDEALQCWRQAQARQAHHAEATYNSSVHAWRGGEMNDREVIQRLEELRRSRGSGARNEHLLGKIHLAFAQYRQAVDCFDRALASDPGDADLARDQTLALWGLAAAQDEPERWRDALPTLEEAVRRGRPDARLAVAYAASLYETGREPEARSFYTDARSRIMELPMELATAISSYRPGSDFVHRWRPFTRPAVAAALSRNGRVAAAADEAQVIVWDATAGTASARLPRTRTHVETLALSADGALLLVAQEHEPVQVFDALSGRRRHSLQPHQGRLNQLCLSRDGHLAAAGSSDRRVRVWRLEDGRLQHQLEGHTAAVSAVALDAAAERLVSGSIDGSLRLWELGTGRCLEVLSGHRGRISSVALSPDGTTLLSGGEDGDLRLWDLGRGSCGRILRGHAEKLHQVAFCSKGTRVVSASADGSVRRWDLASGEPEIMLRFPTDVQVFDLAEDETVALSSVGDEILLVRPFSRRPYSLPYVLCTPTRSVEASDRSHRFEQLLDEARGQTSRREFVNALATLREARRVPGFERDPEAIALWQRVSQRFPREELLGAWERLGYETFAGPVTAVAADPRRARAAVGLASGEVAVVDLTDKHLYGPWKLHDNLVSALCFNRDGDELYSASWDRRILASDPADGSLRKSYVGHEDYVLDVAASPDRRHLLSAGSDGTLRWWVHEAPDVSEILSSCDSSIAACAVSPDGCFAISADWDGQLGLWDVHKRRELATLGEDRSPATAVDISPDGQLAVSAGIDHSVRLWDLVSGRCLRVLEGHRDFINAVCFSPDGRFVATASKDHTARLWDLRESRCIRIFDAHGSGVTDVAFDASGTSMVSVGQDGTARVWHLDWEPQTAVATRPWDDRARPFLELFLNRRLELDPLPATGEHLRLGRDDLRELHRELMTRGFGWLPADAVREQLQQLANEWPGGTSAWRSLKARARERRSGLLRQRRSVSQRRLAVLAAAILIPLLALVALLIGLRVPRYEPAMQDQRRLAQEALSPDFVPALAQRCRDADLPTMLRWSLDPLEANQFSVSCLTTLADEHSVVALADRLRELARLVSENPEARIEIEAPGFLTREDGSPLLSTSVPVQHELQRIDRLCYTVFSTMDPEGSEILAHYLRDPLPRLSTLTAEALAARGDQASLAALEQAAATGRRSTRLAVARALPRLISSSTASGRRLLALTRELCRDGAAEVRAAAVEALPLFAHRGARRLARELGEDPAPAVAAAARRSFEVLQARRR